MNREGAKAAEEAIAAGAIAFGVVLEERVLRFEDAGGLLEVAARHDIDVVFAVGLSATAAGAGA